MMVNEKWTNVYEIMGLEKFKILTEEEKAAMFKASIRASLGEEAYQRMQADLEQVKGIVPEKVEHKPLSGKVATEFAPSQNQNKVSQTDKKEIAPKANKKGTTNDPSQIEISFDD
jgi:hypothetical protein